MADSEGATQRRRREGPETEFRLHEGTPVAASATDHGSKIKARDRGTAADAGGIGILDVLRVLGGLFVLSSALSYFITNESILWGYRPWFTRLNNVKAWLRGPINLTDAELALYDGTDPNKPIYLGLNGSIYDVTAGRHFYGPGGSYHFFAGRDAARAFVTGCFQEDLTPDLRGAEEMYVPVDVDDPASSPDDTANLHHGPAEVEQDGELIRKGGKKGVKKAELKLRREREYRVGRKKVQDAIEGWAMTFKGEKGKPYFWVGNIVREEGWLERLPRRDLCDQAKKARPKRKDDNS